MEFQIGTNPCHPEDEIRRISKKNEQKVFSFAHNDKKCAFTMAEVLITLGIIGIIAAMTLPTLIRNQRNKALETAFKKNYSAISRALDMYQAENGERLTSETVGLHELKPILVKYMNVLQDCGWYDCVSASSTIYKNFNGTNKIVLGLLDDGQFILNDGSLILIENAGTILLISVDVNGHLKKPNRLGQDLFMFQIDNKGNLIPMGAKGTHFNSGYCSPNSTSDYNGFGCTIRAINEKDYFTNLH